MHDGEQIKNEAETCADYDVKLYHSEKSDIFLRQQDKLMGLGEPVLPVKTARWGARVKQA